MPSAEAYYDQVLQSWTVGYYYGPGAAASKRPVDSEAEAKRLAAEFNAKEKVKEEKRRARQAEEEKAWKEKEAAKKAARAAKKAGTAPAVKRWAAGKKEG